MILLLVYTHTKLIKGRMISWELKVCQDCLLKLDVWPKNNNKKYNFHHTESSPHRRRLLDYLQSWVWIWSCWNLFFYPPSCHPLMILQYYLQIIFISNICPHLSSQINSTYSRIESNIVSVPDNPRHWLCIWYFASNLHLLILLHLNFGSR